MQPHENLHNFSVRSVLAPSRWWTLMARVMIQCPKLSRNVPTGMRMTASQLEAAPAKYAFRCSACSEIHHWVRADAWVELSNKY